MSGINSWNVLEYPERTGYPEQEGGGGCRAGGGWFGEGGSQSPHAKVNPLHFVRDKRHPNRRKLQTRLADGIAHPGVISQMTEQGLVFSRVTISSLPYRIQNSTFYPRGTMSTLFNVKASAA
jgi:hypothetical protein